MTNINSQLQLLIAAINILDETDIPEHLISLLYESKDVITNLLQPDHETLLREDYLNDRSITNRPSFGTDKPSFGKRSKKRLQTCHSDIQRVFEEVITHIDCTIICGYRTQEEQNEAYHTGHSKVIYPNGKHNKQPSLAVDVIPYPIDWNDRERMTLFAGYVLATADSMGINMKWGGDWNKDWNVKNNSFDDLVHFELVGLAHTNDRYIDPMNQV